MHPDLEPWERFVAFVLTCVAVLLMAGVGIVIASH